MDAGTMMTYNANLVVLSIVVAICAFYTALETGRRAQAAEGWRAIVLVLAATSALAGGLWGMGFIGMLAMRVPLCLSCNVASTTGSLCLALLSAAIGFISFYYRPGRIIPLSAAAILMGGGFGAMHYVYMLAVPTSIQVDYSPFLIGASISLSIITCFASLYLLRVRPGKRARWGMAVVLGMAMGGMQYIGTSAASLHPDPITPQTSMESVQTNTHLVIQHYHRIESERFNIAIIVMMGIFVVLCLSLLAAAYDRRLSGMLDREAQLLREAEERSRQRYRKTPAPLHSVDGQDRLIEVSDAWLALLGYERHEVVGRSITAFMDAASAERRREASEIKGNDREEYIEYRFLTKQGGEVDVMLSVAAERDTDGQIRSMVEALVDITARRRMEEMFRQSQKLEAVGQLTGGIAHDFNNLLTVIVGSIELAQQAHEKDRSVQRYLTTMRDAAERGAALTQQLLAFSRRQPLRPERVDPKALVEASSELLTKTLRQDVELRVSVPSGLPYIKIDPGNFKVALLNIGLNAQDAMPKGGVLTISVGPVPIDSPMHGKMLAITVEDTGTGIPPELLSKVLEPFFTTKDVGKGSGLGLSQAYGFAHQSRGRLLISSKIGAGTTVSFWLPIDGAVMPKMNLQDGPLPPRQDGIEGEHKPNDLVFHGNFWQKPTRPTRVLLVEDDMMVAEMAATVLKEAGYSIHPVNSAVAAKVLLERDHAFDLVFSDVVMPGGMSGLDLGQWIRATYPNVPVLLTTGYVAGNSSVEMQQFPVLSKPYRQQKLLDMVYATLHDLQD